MKKVIKITSLFFKGVIKLLKSMKTLKGLISLFISFMFWNGVVMMVLSYTMNTYNLLVLIPSTILFWNTPFTPFLALMIGLAVFIQKFVFRDKNTLTKQELLDSFKEEK